MDPYLNFNASSRAFLDSFDDFAVDCASQPITEFSRLAAGRGWAPGSNTWRQQWRRCFGRSYVGQVLPPHGGNEFFEGYRNQGFVPNANNTLQREFQRLAQHMRWTRKSTAYSESRTEAFSAEMRGFFGDHMSKLEQWQQLCREVLLDDIPTSINKCRQALGHRCVNLVDLMNSRRLRQVPQIFPSKRDLCDHTFDRSRTAESRVFPLEAAKEGSVVKILLEDFRRHRRYL